MGTPEYAGATIHRLQSLVLRPTKIRGTETPYLRNHSWLIDLNAPGERNGRQLLLFSDACDVAEFLRAPVPLEARGVLTSQCRVPLAQDRLFMEVGDIVRVENGAVHRDYRLLLRPGSDHLLIPLD